MKARISGSLDYMNDIYNEIREHMYMHGFVTVADFHDIAATDIESVEDGYMGWTSMEGINIIRDDMECWFTIEFPDPQPVATIKKRSELDMNEYQKLAMRTCSIPYDNKNDRLYHAVFGLNSEAGEVAGILQKEYQGHEIDPEHLKKELGDCLWMIAEACDALDISMSEVAQMNIDKLKARYPEGFEVERSLNRAEGDV